MKRMISWLALAFLATFGAHVGFWVWRAERLARQWAEVGDASPLALYFRQHDYLLGAAYGLCAAFAVYALLRAREGQRAGVKAAAGGVTLAGLLYFGGCWLLGCCGSPLLPVYLSVFGSAFLGFTKPLVLASTAASVAVGVWWMERKTPAPRGCGCGDPACRTKDDEPLQKIRAELTEGIGLSKCRQCGCMKETLEQLGAVQPALAAEIAGWQKQMTTIQYACLGCAHCYPAVAMNVLHQALPETAQAASLSCEFEVRSNTWPPVPGEYAAFCEGESCPVAVSTLASPELAETLARRRPRELCIVGKTETENIGIEKLIKNTITNRTIRFLVVAGREPQGHETGKTLMALAANGVDDAMRVIGSPGKRPVLRNVGRDEVEAFRRQVRVVDMIGCEDAEQITRRVREMAATTPTTSACDAPATLIGAPVVQAQPPARVEMDKAGYFVILARSDKAVIVVEHYDYENRLLRTIEGRDARSLYSTIIANGWVTQLSHAAYLGKELARAEHALCHGGHYIQDGA